MSAKRRSADVRPASANTSRGPALQVPCRPTLRSRRQLSSGLPTLTCRVPISARSAIAPIVPTTLAAPLPVLIKTSLKACARPAPARRSPACWRPTSRRGRRWCRHGPGQPEPATEATAAAESDVGNAQSRSGGITWARLLDRIDMRQGPNCSGVEPKVIAAIPEPAAIQQMLEHLRLDPRLPPRAPAREPRRHSIRLRPSAL